MSSVKKILGLVLLFAGIIIIVYSLYYSFNIFTAKITAPEIFKTETAVSPAKGGVEEMISQQLKGMIPADSMPQLLNLISWSIFASLLIFGGGQVSGIGIKLLK